MPGSSVQSTTGWPADGEAEARMAGEQREAGGAVTSSRSKPRPAARETCVGERAERAGAPQAAARASAGNAARSLVSSRRPCMHAGLRGPHPRSGRPQSGARPRWARCGSPRWTTGTAPAGCWPCGGGGGSGDGVRAWQRRRCSGAVGAAQNSAACSALRTPAAAAAERLTPEAPAPARPIGSSNGPAGRGARPGCAPSPLHNASSAGRRRRDCGSRRGLRRRQPVRTQAADPAVAAARSDDCSRAPSQKSQARMEGPGCLIHRGPQIPAEPAARLSAPGLSTSPACTVTLRPCRRACSSAGSHVAHCECRQIGQGRAVMAGQQGPASAAGSLPARPPAGPASQCPMPCQLRPLRLLRLLCTRCAFFLLCSHLAHAGVAAEVEAHHAFVLQRHRQARRVQSLFCALPPVDGQQQAHLDVCGRWGRWDAKGWA